MNVIPDKVNVNRRAWTAEQCQRASPDQDQAGSGWDPRSYALQDGVNFNIIHNLSLPLT